MKTKKKNGKVIVYTYGKPFQFTSIKKAREWCLEGMIACDGSERERFWDIDLMLADGNLIAWDCDGIPTKKVDENGPLTESEWALLAMKRKVGEDLSKRLDVAHKILKVQEDELRKQLAPYQKIVDDLAQRWNDNALDIIRLERRTRIGRED